MQDRERALARFDPALPAEEAWTPPSSWYVAPEFLEWERAAVFGRNWLCLGPSAQVAAPGTFAARVLLGSPVVATRDAGGELRAFHNACRHHGTAVASGAGCARELTCPYHGWTYGLDGRLKRAPGVGKIAAFDPAEFGLAPLAVRALGPLLFAAEPGAEPALFEAAAPVWERLRARGWERLAHVASRRYEIECNWKVFVDNYLDGGYHVAHMHGDLAALLDLDSYAVETGARFSIQSSRTAAASGSARRAGSERVGADACYAFVHPNLMINRYGPWLDVNVVQPLGAGRSEVLFDYWVDAASGAPTPAELAAALAASDRVQQEDMTVCAAVQTGLGSRGYDRGRYAAREVAMHAFHRQLHAELSRP